MSISGNDHIYAGRKSARKKCVIRRILRYLFMKLLSYYDLGAHSE